VTVYLNAVLVVDNVVMENQLEREKPIYSLGQTELQSHSNPLYFRNIFISEIISEKRLSFSYKMNVLLNILNLNFFLERILQQASTTSGS